MTNFTEQIKENMFAVFQFTKNIFQKLDALIRRMTARDSLCIVLLLISAFLLRIPMLGNPPVSQFDEVTYANFALFTNAEKPFFDIHPRLAHVLFAVVANTHAPFRVTALPLGEAVSFQDFPYIKLRTFIACAGILLTLLIYTIARVLGYKPRTALVPALCILFDGALTVYGRAILPDTLLLFFNFLGILLTLLAIKFPHRVRTPLYIAGSGIVLGAGLSIKWTAGAVLLTAIVAYFLYGRFRAGIAVGIIALGTYLAIFACILIMFFPSGGSVKNFQNVNYPSWIMEMNFPNSDSFVSTVKFLPALHVAMLKANNDPQVLAGTLSAPSPLSWPIARTEMIFLHNYQGRNIIMAGNALLWVVSFFALLFNFFWIYFTWKRTSKFPIEKDELILLFGYCANYLPFFLIHRPMYLYHYFTALLFLFLLLPKITPRILHCLGEVTNDRLFAKTFIMTVALLIVLNFFLARSLTYGW